MREYLKKQMRIKERNLKYDFLPSMTEIIEHPTNKLGYTILFIIFAMLISTVLWAAFCKIDIAVTATGTVVPENGVITLYSMQSGNVRKICVSNGTVVKEGEDIVVLDEKETEQSLLEQQYEREVLMVQRELQGMIYEALKEKRTEKLSDFQAEKYGEYSSVADAVILENQLFLSEVEKINSEEEKERMRQEQLYRLLQSMNTLDGRIKNIEFGLERAKNKLEKYRVPAVTDGKIELTDSLHEGSVVMTGDILGYLLPQEAQKVFVAYLADEDISQIQIGDVADIKITAYDGTEAEYLKGQVSYIGDIAQTMEYKGKVYRIEIRVPDFPEEIKVGMEGNCNIIIGQRSVLDYFLDPFKKGLEDSLKER